MKILLVAFRNFDVHLKTKKPSILSALDFSQTVIIFNPFCDRLVQGDPQEPDIFKINNTQLFFK